jgi:hypothetical protein
VCDYFTNPGAGPGTALSDFNGDSAAGTWYVCVGDCGNLRAGTIDMIRLVVHKVI